MPIITAEKISPENYRIGIVVSRFNEEITSQLYEGAIERLQALGFEEDQIIVVWVPGAVEIPLIAQFMAGEEHEPYDAIIALGAVIRGETGHYDYVCEQVSQGCQRVSLDFDIPVIFGVLTTDNVAQAYDRVGGAHGHKGVEAADTACEMLSLLEQVRCDHA